jgi:hypothetical protein
MADPLRGPLQEKRPATGWGAVPNTTIVAPGPTPEVKAEALRSLDLPPLVQLSDGKALKDPRISNDHKAP